ncbi:transcriptional regulator PpsR [Jannaschia marina]|uniref:transcriptional regulator PpsR n=1 Tax=Jannaschia marina TaxID=2741674 RepID=UPI0015CC7A01|nr:transcriptional regulator PpsR [Jannaschia marina]
MTKAAEDEAWFAGFLPGAPVPVLADLVGGLADIALLVDWSGRVTDLRLRPGLDGVDRLSSWVGDDLRTHLTRESTPKLDRCLETLRGGGGTPASELNLRPTSQGPELPMSFSFHRVGWENDVLMLGRDLRPLAEIQQQLVSAQLAIERDYEAQRVTEAQLNVLLETMTDACFFVNVTDRSLTTANAAAARLLGERRKGFDGVPLDRLFRPMAEGDMLEQLVTASHRADARVGLLRRDGARALEVAATSFRVPGAHMLLCRILTVPEVAANDDPDRPRFAELFNACPEAVAFVSIDGTILSANPAFLDLVEVAQESQLEDRSLAEFLTRGGLDLSVLLANVGQSGSMRLFSLLFGGGTGRPVEASVTRLDGGMRPVFGLVIRDMSRAGALRGPRRETAAVDMDSVVELLGQQSLKEIVAQATDVIERMCICAAVDLTSNNRVAAADILGLSRQSLYVKLRKYDLLKRDAAE